MPTVALLLVLDELVEVEWHFVFLVVPEHCWPTLGHSLAMQELPSTLLVAHKLDSIGLVNISPEVRILDLHGAEAIKRCGTA